MHLQQYNFEIQHRPGKSNANADALSRLPNEEVNSMDCFHIEDWTFTTTSQHIDPPIIIDISDSESEDN